MDGSHNILLKTMFNDDNVMVDEDELKDGFTISDDLEEVEEEDELTDEEEEDEEEDEEY